MATSHSISPHESLGMLCLAVAGIGTVGLVAGLLHELLHVAISYAVDGAVDACGSFGPLLVTRHRLAVCLADEVSAWNALMTPAVVSALGVLAMWGSAFLPSRGARWGLFAGGAVVWLREALYSAGWLVPPTVTHGGVTYWGDGRVALRAYGAEAQLPGALLVLAGCLLLYKRLGYQPDPEPIAP